MTFHINLKRSFDIWKWHLYLVENVQAKWIAAGTADTAAEAACEAGQQAADYEREPWEIVELKWP